MPEIFADDLRSRQMLAASLFESAVERDRLSHAYLLTGRALPDKWLVANSLARFLNCEQADRRGKGPCAQAAASACQNCRWIASQEHPQAWLTLTGDDTKTGKISVEKARALAEELGKTSSYHRVVVIPEAAEGSFHRPSANALLKTIEEPAGNTLFVLFAAHEADVLATIVSRCQVVPILKPGQSGLWLPDEQEAPGRAAELAALKQSINDLTAGRFGRDRSPKFGKNTASALEWAAELSALVSESSPAELVVDLALAAQVEALRQKAAADPDVSRYLCRVGRLTETTKEQIEHYVKPATAIEALALALHQLDCA